jgi:hypothetical protein
MCKVRAGGWLALTFLVNICLVSGAAARVGNYLIVSAPDYASSDPLIQFKNAKSLQGLTVRVYTVPTGTTNTAIKNYIMSLWGTPDAPDYILLVGDSDGSTSGAATIPHFTGGGSKHAPTDLPYGCMDAGDDWYPEVPVGRFPVRNLTQLQAMVDKTLTVESGNFSDPTYVLRAAFLATDDSSAQAEQTHDWVINNYLLPAGFNPIRIYAAQGGNTQMVTDAVNQGCLFVNYFGHSSSSGWWAPSFNQSNVNALSNAGLYGLVFGFSCNTAAFPGTSECFGETWVRAANKGAAAYISASTYIYYGGSAWESSRRLEKYFWASFFVDNIWEVGPAWKAGLYRFLADPYFSDDIKRNMLEMFVLLGDPSLYLPALPQGPDPTVRVIAPNGGEIWACNQGYDIRYTARDDVEVTAIDIYLSTDGGATFPYTVASGLPNTGVYHWNVPPRNSSHCRIKVVAYDGEGRTGEDVSDGDFTITPFGPRVIYDLPLDADPGWTTEGLWAFGRPTGGGGEYGCPDPASGHTGLNVYGYNLNGDYENSMPERHLTSTPFDCSHVSRVRLAFWRWLGVEQPTYDHARVRVSNNGTSWTTVWENTSQIADGMWVYQELDISSVADHQPSVYLRWTMGPTDSSWRFCGWNIDDIQIIGVPDIMLGDVNCDGAVNAFDIDAFVLALTDPAGYAIAYPACDINLADVNGDGVVNAFDIDPFVELLTGG